MPKPSKLFEEWYGKFREGASKKLFKDQPLTRERFEEAVRLTKEREKRERKRLATLCPHGRPLVQMCPHCMGIG